MRRNRSENYEFFQAVSHFSHDPTCNKHSTADEAKKIFSLYVADTAPLKVALGDDVRSQIEEVCARRLAGHAGKRGREGAHATPHDEQARPEESYYYCCASSPLRAIFPRCVERVGMD